LRRAFDLLESRKFGGGTNVPATYGGANKCVARNLEGSVGSHGSISGLAHSTLNALSMSLRTELPCDSPAHHIEAVDAFLNSCQNLVGSSLLDPLI
jgi:hypothetical protein